MNHFFAKSVHTTHQAWLVPSDTAKDFFKETNSVALRQGTYLKTHRWDREEKAHNLVGFEPMTSGLQGMWSTAVLIPLHTYLTPKGSLWGENQKFVTLSFRASLNCQIMLLNILSDSAFIKKTKNW